MSNKRIFPFMKFLRTSGGDPQGIGDYSITAADFFLTPSDFVGDFGITASTQFCVHVHQLIPQIVGAAGFGADDYGVNGVGALPVGISILWLDADDAITYDYTDGLPIKTNSHWARTAFDDQYQDYGVGQGDKFLHGRLSFSKFTQDNRGLVLSSGEKLAARLNDNFGAGGQALVAHTFLIRGEIAIHGINSRI